MTLPLFFLRNKQATRNHLIALFSRANQTEDMDKSLLFYTKILNIDNLENYFSEQEVADVYYNRSVNYTEIADFHFKEEAYKTAHEFMRYALSDVKNAEIRYLKPEDKAVCSKRMTEYEANRQLVLVEQKKADVDFELVEGYTIASYMSSM
ncbi:MAG: hypothetical protein QNK11_08735 [Legionella sp.]|nr:hypothetical protein [Legionella sp.]